MRRFDGLQVWERSHAVVLEAYRLTRGFPAHERYGLTSQLRRAAVSVPTNIAEGSKRRSHRNFAHFLNIAKGSLAEAGYLVVLARDLGNLNAGDAGRIGSEAEEVQRMLAVLRRKVEEAE